MVPCMFRLLFLLLLTLTLAAEEAPVVLKGQFHGKVRDQAFEQPFEVRLEPGEKNEFRVEMEGVDLSLGLSPKWHYTQGATPDGLEVFFYLKCRASEPKLVLQRSACIMTPLGKPGSLDLNDKDATDLFTVDYEVDKAPVNP